MKKVISAVALTAAMFATTPAFAWGDKEQGILIGIIAGEIWDEVQDQRRHRNGGWGGVYEDRRVYGGTHRNDRRYGNDRYGQIDYNQACQEVRRPGMIDRYGDRYTEVTILNCYGNVIAKERHY